MIPRKRTVNDVKNPRIFSPKQSSIPVSPCMYLPIVAPTHDHSIQPIKFCTKETKSPVIVKLEENIEIDGPIITADTDWIEKERITQLSDFYNRTKQWNECHTWFQSRTKPMLMFDGPPGTGKTSMAYFFLKYNKFEVIETNASDQRGHDEMEQFIKKLNTGNVYDLSKKKAYLLEELDGAYNNDEDPSKDSLTKLVRLFDSLKNQFHTLPPIIATCNEYSRKVLKKLHPYLCRVTFQKLDNRWMHKLCFHLIYKNKFPPLQESEASLIVREANGDVRQLIYLLHLHNIIPSPVKNCGESRLFSSNIFQLIKLMFTNCKLTIIEEDFFKQQTYAQALVYENYPKFILKQIQPNILKFQQLFEIISILGFMQNYQTTDIFTHALILATRLTNLTNNQVFEDNRSLDIKPVDQSFYTKYNSRSGNNWYTHDIQLHNEVNNKTISITPKQKQNKRIKK